MTRTGNLIHKALAVETVNKTMFLSHLEQQGKTLAGKSDMNPRHFSPLFFFYLRSQKKLLDMDLWYTTTSARGRALLYTQLPVLSVSLRLSEHFALAHACWKRNTTSS